jgi:hypothetical protein
MKNYNKGFVVPLVITFVALLIISGGVYMFNKDKKDSSVLIDNSKTAVLTADNIEEFRFKENADLIVLQKELFDFQNSLRVSKIPPDDTSVVFKRWAMALYRDSLLLGILRVDSDDPVLPELFVAYNQDSNPNIELLKKCKLGDGPEQSIVKLLSQVQNLSGNITYVDASSINEGFSSQFKNAKDRLNTHYMSLMKDLFRNKQATLEAKIEYVSRFITINDVTMAEYPVEYFQELLKSSELSSTQADSVKRLLEDISKLRTKIISSYKLSQSQQIVPTVPENVSGDTISTQNNLTNDAKRRSSLTHLLSAVYGYAIDHNGTFPATIPSFDATVTDQLVLCNSLINKSSYEVCKTSGDDCKKGGIVRVDLGTYLLPNGYLKSIPIDPFSQNQEGSGYFIAKSKENRILICAPNTENGSMIRVMR